MKTWFTADTHFGHANIIKYCNRPFKDIDRMNEILIKNWNSRVKKNDIVLFLGDFCFKSKSKRGEGLEYKPEYYLSQLNGHITFIKGNHDNNNSLDARISSLIVNISDKNIFCNHFPENFDSRFKINLTAHVHEKWKIRKIYNSFLINVGIDVWKYSPVNINEILSVLNKYKKGLVDENGNRKE